MTNGPVLRRANGLPGDGKAGSSRRGPCLHSPSIRQAAVSNGHGVDGWQGPLPHIAWALRAPAHPLSHQTVLSGKVGIPMSRGGVGSVGNGAHLGKGQGESVRGGRSPTRPPCSTHARRKHNLRHA